MSEFNRKLTLADLKVETRKALPKMAAFAEHLSGRTSDVALWECEGALLGDGVFIGRESTGDAWALCLKVGGEWAVMQIYPSYDPAILRIQDQFTAVGLSPEQQRVLENRRRREVDRQKLEERERKEQRKLLQQRRAEWDKQARAENDERYRAHGPL